MGDMAQTCLIDIHLHLCEPELHSRLPQLLDTAASRGVKRWAVNTAKPEEWPVLARLARQDRRIVPFFGLHPWFVSGAPEDWPDQLEGYLQEFRAGVGEIGLDRWIEPRDEEAQKRAFEIQLDLARRLGVPACIHCLRAWGEMMDILGPAKPLPAGMLFHAYGGSVEIMRQLEKKNAFFSFAGDTADPKYKTKRESLVEAAPERLLIETDAPDMLPPEQLEPESIEDSRGRKRNVPANLPAIARALAKIRDVPLEELARTTFANSQRLLRPLLDPRS